LDGTSTQRHEHEHPSVAACEVHQAEVDGEDEGMSMRPHGQSEIESVMQSSSIIAILQKMANAKNQAADYTT